MVSTTREDYLNKRNALIVQNVNKTKLENLKMLYEKDINSTRRLSVIDSVGSLIEVLEKRACVSEKDTTILDNIAKEINYNSPKTNQQSFVELAPVTQHRASSATEKVHQEIILKLGKQWIDFARALGVQDGDIDTIYKNIYSKNPRECIEAVLMFHKNNALSRDWKLLLLDALTACRRNDLRNRIEVIFEHF